MSVESRFPKTNKIWNYSNPRLAQRNAYRYLGRSAILYRSKKREKKYTVKVPESNKIVHFGQMGYEDFTKHKDRNRRKNYLTRSRKIRGKWATNKYSPNNLAQHILW